MEDLISFKFHRKTSLKGGGGGRFAPGGSTAVTAVTGVGVTGGVEAASDAAVEAAGVVLMLSVLVLKGDYNSQKVITGSIDLGGTW